MKEFTRRTFVHTSAKSALGIAAGAAILPRALGATKSANDKVLLALIGAGGRGSGLARNFAQVPNVEFKYVCEVNEANGRELTKDLEKSQGRAPQRLSDFRQALEDKELDGVVVATPEHWHALATIWACQAGKDVYVEKNPSLRIWEGRKMIEAGRKYNRIVQVGFQNRSAPYAASARKYVAAGKLGKVVLVKVYNLLSGGAWKAQADAPTPAGVNWDLWLGPARHLPFNPGRLHGWVEYWDYMGGVLAGDGSHQLDLTRMVLGDPPHPRSVTCRGGILAFADQRETPDIQVISYDFGDYLMTCENGTFTPYMKKFPNEVRYGKEWPNWALSSCRAKSMARSNSCISADTAAAGRPSARTARLSPKTKAISRTSGINRTLLIAFARAKSRMRISSNRITAPVWYIWRTSLTAPASRSLGLTRRRKSSWIVLRQMHS